MVAAADAAARGPRPWVRGTLIVLGLALLIVAAARPRFGVYFEKVDQRGVDCFVLLDVSRSMLAEDVAPNRLERAKSDIRDLLKKLAGDRVGLIVFAGKPVLKVPLTTDDGFFRTVLDDVDTHSAPRGGTLIGDAIRKALDAMPPRGDRDQVIVLLTDGEDQESYPIEAAKQAAEARHEDFHRRAGRFHRRGSHPRPRRLGQHPVRQGRGQGTLVEGRIRTC